MGVGKARMMDTKTPETESTRENRDRFIFQLIPKD